VAEEAKTEAKVQAAVAAHEPVDDERPVRNNELSIIK